MTIELSQLKIGDKVPVPPKPKPEKEIMANWQGELTQPLVSIVCHTFNHINYLEDALNGFLMQETDFPFEIILHDDASTDGTTEIVKRYSEAYPGIIVPIIQKENQYSKGVKPSCITFPKARGKYIAFCEGDDYWFIKDKISSQFYIMGKYKDASICFHSSYETDEYSGDCKIVNCYSKNISLVPSKNIIVERGASMPSVAIFFKNKNIPKLLKSYKEAPIGDFFLQSYMALSGKVVFLPEPMSVYRRNAIGSWTRGQLKTKKQLEYNTKMVSAIDTFYKEVQSFKGSSLLVIPLCFYMVRYILSDKNPLSIFKRSFQQLIGLKNFSKIYVFLCLIKQIVMRKIEKIMKITRRRG